MSLYPCGQRTYIAYKRSVHQYVLILLIHLNHRLIEMHLKFLEALQREMEIYVNSFTKSPLWHYLKQRRFGLHIWHVLDIQGGVLTL
jgi:hypothetical protein